MLDPSAGQDGPYSLLAGASPIASKTISSVTPCLPRKGMLCPYGDPQTVLGLLDFAQQQECAVSPPCPILASVDMSHSRALLGLPLG